VYKVPANWSATKDDNGQVIYALPDTVTQVRENALLGCGNITAFSVGAANANYIESYGVLFTKNGSRLVAYPLAANGTQYIVPRNVTQIGHRAFSGAIRLTSVETSETNLALVGEFAFEGCVNLSYIGFPPTLTEIGTGAFSGCLSLANLSLPESIKNVADSAFAASGLKEIYVPRSGIVSSDAFFGIDTLIYNEVDSVVVSPPIFTATIATTATTTPTQTTDTSAPDTTETEVSFTDDTTTNTVAPDNTAVITDAFADGDLTGNGTTDITDVLYFRRYLSGWEEYTVTLEHADINGDKIVDLRDYIILKRLIAT
jgi:hypothetical protein